MIDKQAHHNSQHRLSVSIVTPVDDATITYDCVLHDEG